MQRAGCGQLKRAVELGPQAHVTSKQQCDSLINWRGVKTMSNSGSSADRRSSSTGHALSDADWLDTHFAWMRPEYEEMLRWVGIKRGWRVLDAASGPGSFLPLMSELVGPEGKIDAIDLAPENISVLERRAAAEKWPTPVMTQVGNILNLPYADGAFDAVWCANTTQYLTDDELQVMLREFRRVVRPGGSVAVKDYDITLQQIHPTGQHFSSICRGRVAQQESRVSSILPPTVSSCEPPSVVACSRIG